MFVYQNTFQVMEKIRLSFYKTKIFFIFLIMVTLENLLSQKDIIEKNFSFVYNFFRVNLFDKGL